jgi:precorrin-2/cobalt-factor-2 C20-methyltransferase
MRISKLYGIGVGPGDPELLTVKAYKVLKEVDMIVAPRSREGKRSLALRTIERFIEERRENKPLIIEPLFPMTRNEEELAFYWGKAKREVLERGKGCKTIAFLTLGDPSLYSTFYKFLDFFEEEVEEVEIIPGVTSFSACSALAKVPIAEGDEIVSIIPDIQEGNDHARGVIQHSDSLIFLKPKNTDAIKSMLGNKRAILGVKVGFEDQKLVVGNLTELKEPTHYLSTLIVKKEPRDSTTLFLFRKKKTCAKRKTKGRF